MVNPILLLGMCGVTYREADAAGTIDSFALGEDSGNQDDGDFDGNTGVGATCAKTTHQFITIQPIGKICGGILSALEGQAVAGPVESK